MANDQQRLDQALTLILQAYDIIAEVEDNAVSLCLNELLDEVIELISMDDLDEEEEEDEFDNDWEEDDDEEDDDDDEEVSGIY